MRGINSCNQLPYLTLIAPAPELEIHFPPSVLLPNQISVIKAHKSYVSLRRIPLVYARKPLSIHTDAYEFNIWFPDLVCLWPNIQGSHVSASQGLSRNV